MDPARASSLTRGQVVGGWTLESRLPGGSLGPVWRASRRQGSASAAVLKFAEPPYADDDTGAPDDFARADDPDRAARLVQEARRLARLAHPDIVPLLDAGRHGEWVWIALAWIDGPDLTTFLPVDRRLPAGSVAGLLAQVADALEHAHRLGIVHRDLKPANIRIDRSTGRARLLDFGVSTDAAGGRTRTGRAIGSPAYQAPELLAGAAPDVASDVFALGVTLFELLSGRRPWQGDSLGALLRSVAQDPPADLAALRPDLPPALLAVVRDCLARDPRARPASAQRLAARLRDAVGLTDSSDTAP
jgi:serine/threonine protein kinase